MKGYTTTGVELHERFVLFSRIKRAMQKKHGEKEDYVNN